MTNAIEWENGNIVLGALTPYERNPRNCTAKQFKILKSSIERLGFHTPVICTIDYRILGGHQRLRALAELGVTHVPIRRATRELTDQEFKEVNLSSNLNAGGWDMEILSNDFEVAELLELGFPEALLGIGHEEPKPEAKEPPEPKEPKSCPHCGGEL